MFRLFESMQLTESEYSAKQVVLRARLACATARMFPAASEQHFQHAKTESTALLPT